VSYIITSRCMRDHHLVGMHLPPPKPADPSGHAMQPYVAWHDYLAETAWKERKVRLSGGPVVTLKRGQVISAVGYWAKRWNWTEKTVRGWFAKLVNDGMIAFEGVSKGRLAKVATVCNYDSYQTGDAFKGQVDGQVEGTLRASKGQHQIQDTNIPVESMGDAPPPSAPAKAKVPRKVGERLPDDWVLPPEWKAWAVAEFGATEKAVAHQAMLFRNHWTAKAGKDATKRDWERTWQTWCHKAREYTEKRGHKNGHTNGAAVAFTGARSDIADWNARQQAALERQLKDLEFQP
jgi:hypothetical protein